MIQNEPLRVELNDRFWGRQEELVRTAAIPYQWDALNDRAGSSEPSRAIRNFRIAAGLETGEFYGMVFQDSDVYKWLEGVGCSLQHHPDEHLKKLADETIELIGKAQQPDGYVNTYFTVKEPGKRWTNLFECHELYCAGHLMEAAVAYDRGTGERRLLDIACRFADYIGQVFGPEPGKLKGYPGHQEVEWGLIRLYRATGEKRYLDLAAYFLKQRGRTPCYFDEEWEKRGKVSYWSHQPSGRPSEGNLQYNQARLPVTEQDKAVGHAVRAVYMYTAMAALAAETGDETFTAACKTLWNDIQDAQLYITGGVGSTHHGEAFTFDYDLPNDTVYSETCASVGLIFFARNMLALEHRAAYADVMEQALYNVILSSMSLDGKHFFYVNPLEVWPEASEKDPGKAHVKAERQSWFGCACCPPNLVRLIESLTDYIYSAEGGTLFVDLFIGSRAALPETGFALRQESGLPDDGAVTLTVESGTPAPCTLALRRPGWCRQMSLSVNGERVEAEAGDDGYIRIRRAWKAGDTVRIAFDLPVEVLEANPLVRADAGKAALRRGPVVYCLEEADNGANLSALTLTAQSGLTARYEPDLLGGVTVVTGQAARRAQSGWDGRLYRPLALEEETVPFKAIPYYAWGNRGKGEMQVWTRWR